MALTRKLKDKRISEINLAMNELRPHLAVDGGDVEILDLSDDMIVKIKWLGNCVNCSMSSFTLKAGLESVIKSKFPDIMSVEAVN